tara:strand:- start:712 stop:1023 length:312 start_codon:yes stop_codon:yes gene_type:complete
MKIEDLMIGNWVYNNLLKKPLTISNGHFLRTYSTKHLEPIPLTEENIVDLLGFKRNCHYDYLFFKDNICVDFLYKKVTVDIKTRCTIPKHVHKLQQLIKSLEE